MSISIHVYIGDSYTFFLQVTESLSIRDLTLQIESHINQFFRSDTYDKITLFSIADMGFADLPPHYPALRVLPSQAPVICYLNLGSVQRDQFVLHQIYPLQSTLTLTAVRSTLSEPQRQQALSAAPPPFPMQPLPLPQPSRKCTPYCLPLCCKGELVKCACGEVKAYAVSETQLCTDHCRTADQRKQKAAGMDFCSICMSRYRNSKYVRGQPHQCKICDRPWLLLNNEGVCRSCHCEAQSGTRNIPFRQADFYAEEQKAQEHKENCQCHKCQTKRLAVQIDSEPIIDVSLKFEENQHE